MKRSEMVKILQAAVQDSNGDFGWYEEEQAEFVLKELEKAGMLPPEALMDVDDSYEFNGCLCERIVRKLVNKWEPEDER